MQGGDAIAANLAKIRNNFEVDSPEKSVPALVKLADMIEKVPDVYWRNQKTRELDDLITACAGLWFESYAAQPSYAIGDQIQVRSEIINHYNDKVSLAGLTIGGQAILVLPSTDLSVSVQPVVIKRHTHRPTANNE